MNCHSFIADLKRNSAKFTCSFHDRKNWTIALFFFSPLVSMLGKLFKERAPSLCYEKWKRWIFKNWAVCFAISIMQYAERMVNKNK